MKSKLEEEIEVLRKELEGETAARMAKIKAEFDGKLSVETERLKKISEKKDKTEEELQEEVSSINSGGDECSIRDLCVLQLSML